MKRVYYLQLIAVLAIIITGIWLRSYMLRYQGFFEPDGFFHYAVMMQAVKDGFIPNTSALSGFPTHNAVSEPEGFYYMTLIPYALFMHSISVYTIERDIPVFFGVLDMVAAFFIAKKIAKSNALGILAMLFVALSSGDAARTSALVYRGDGFITVFLIASLFFMLKAFEEGKHSLHYMLSSAVILGFGMTVWNGAPFTIVVYLLAIAFIAAYAFIKGSSNLLKKTTELTLFMLVAYAMQHLFMLANVIRGGQALSSWHFFLFYIPVLLESIIAYYLLMQKARVAETAKTRMAFLGIATLAVLAIIVSAFYSYLQEIAGGGGLVIAGNALTKTIQELMPPSFGFLWVSFGLQLVLAPLGIVAFVLLKKWKPANERNDAYLALLAYFLATIYLQLNAQRFNSLVAVPMAIFSAYLIYEIGNIALKSKWHFKFIIPKYIFAIGIIALIAYSSYLSLMQRNVEAQADGINSQFLSAMAWMRNNTPANATVLTLWPDGSVVEGWAERQSYMDSVGGQNENYIYKFAKFLINDSDDTQYLYKVHADYLVVRSFWYSETWGIATEAELNGSLFKNYGMVTLYPLTPSYNSTTKTVIYPLVSSIESKIRAAIAVTGNTLSGYVSFNGSQFYPVNAVALYNTQTENAFEITGTGLNYTLLLYYNMSAKGFNAQSGALIANGLAGSNLFKLVTLCGSDYCPYGNSNITLSLVYSNPDTKIFKINYLR